MDADQLAFHGFDSLGTGVGRGFDCGDVADDDRGDQGITDLCDRAGQFNVGGFEHRVGTLNEGNQTASFDETDSLMRHGFVCFLVNG